MPIWKSQRRDGTLHIYIDSGEHLSVELGYVERLPLPDGQHPWRGVAFSQKFPRDNMNFNTCEEAKTWVAVTVRMQS
jgi:hypothetical protein